MVSRVSGAVATRPFAVRAITPRASDAPEPVSAEFLRLLDIMPVPVGVIEDDGRGLRLIAANREFRSGGLGEPQVGSVFVEQLAERLSAFLASDEANLSFEWQIGEQVDCRAYGVTLARRDAQQARNRCMATLVDRTTELRTQMSLRREMTTDSLTGLPNRTGFTDRLEAAVSEATRARHAVLIVDLDRFARVNACMGALAGDELLISVARRIKGALRTPDVLARTGGDEYGILLTRTTGAADALQVAQRIKDALATPFRLSDFEVQVTCSIGIALGADDADDAGDPENLIRRAQFAVKRSKATRRTEVYQTRAFDVARIAFGMETELRRAVEAGALRLNFQPIVDLSSGEVVKFEALARWRNERGDEVSPSDFIPVAEESGLIVPLGRWALDAAARTLAAWDAAAGGSCGVEMAVNLSAIQLQRDDIPSLVANTLGRYGLRGERFALELTESALITDPDRITRTVRALKGLGTALAMDDFGTGYSNLGYLQKLPIDLLKIDRSFVTRMLSDRDKVAIVRAVLSLAQALGMKTAAEGIETLELGQTLAALGCTYGQGFTYSRPLEDVDAFAYLAKRQVRTAWSASASTRPSSGNPSATH